MLFLTNIESKFIIPKENRKSTVDKNHPFLEWS